MLEQDLAMMLYLLSIEEELDKLFAVIEPTDISFNDESVELELLLKS